MKYKNKKKILVDYATSAVNGDFVSGWSKRSEDFNLEQILSISYASLKLSLGDDGVMKDLLICFTIISEITVMYTRTTKR